MGVTYDLTNAIGILFISVDTSCIFIGGREGNIAIQEPFPAWLTTNVSSCLKVSNKPWIFCFLRIKILQLINSLNVSNETFQDKGPTI